ncbi:hypothetical protein WDW89_19255 [Deltaproteobacteria bacterium TL4]
MDTSQLIVEAAEIVVDVQKDLIPLDNLFGDAQKRATSINNCLRFIRTSEKKLFAIQQKLMSDTPQEKENQAFLKPYPPDINLLNVELLRIAENNAPHVFQEFVQPALRAERQREQANAAAKKVKGDPVDPGMVIHWIPRLVDAVIFLHAPFEIFPFLNTVCEMVCLIEEEDRRLYLLNYMERWLYKFTDFLHSFSKTMHHTLLTITFIKKKEHYPVILEVLKFLHIEENWEGSAAQIQRYNVVRLFLLFKNVLYLHLHSKTPVPPDLSAILSEFTHPFIVEDLDVADNNLMIIALGYYNEPQRFQFLANLKKYRLEKFIELYQQLLILSEANSTQPESFKQLYLTIVKTMNRIIKKSHLLTDPKISETLRSILRREVSRQILVEKNVKKPVEEAANPRVKRLSPMEKLAQLKARAVSETEAGAPVSEAKQVERLGDIVTVSPPPPTTPVDVYQDIPRQRNYEHVQEVHFALYPENVSSLVAWSFKEVMIFQPDDTLYYLLNNFKVTGTLKFREMLEFVRIPFRVEYLTTSKERYIRFVNFAHLIAMQTTEEVLTYVLAALCQSGQLLKEEADLIQKLFPQLLLDENLGPLKKVVLIHQSYIAGGQINPRIFFENYELVAEKMMGHYPYFQQIISYWNFMDQTLRSIAKKLERDACELGYGSLSTERLEMYLARNQMDLYNRIVKDLKNQYHSTFLYKYLAPKLNDILEHRITPDLMSLLTRAVIQFY